MPKVQLGDLQKLREETHRKITLREGGPYRAKVTVHMGTCGIASGARKIMSALLAEMEKKEVRDVMVTTSGCAGLCSREPMMTVELLNRAPVKYVDLTEEKVRKILSEHILGGKIVQEYALAVGSERTE
jgi:NADP-reducing hydrogenase subunit HndB